MPRMSRAQRRKLAEKQRLEEEERIRKEKEEEERKKREAEEARLRKLAEIAEAKRKEEEKKRLIIEEEELKEWRGLIAKNYEEQLKLKELKETWEKHIDCSDRPDASKESDLTAYMTEYSKPFIMDQKTMDPLEQLKQCEYTETILETVQEEMVNAMAKADFKKEQLCKFYMKNYRDITAMKLDEVTAGYSVHSDIMSDEIQKNIEKQKLEMAQQSQQFNKDEVSKNILKEFSFPHIKYGLKINIENKGFMNSNVKFPNLGIVIDKPYKYQNVQMLMRAIHSTYDRYTSNKEYCPKMIIGGVIDVTIYQYLTQPSMGRGGWKMKFDYDQTEDSLIPYEFDVLEMQRGQQDVTFQFTLPDKVFILPDHEHEVGIFTNGHWTTDNITDVTYDHHKKEISFKTYSLKPHAFISSRCLDYPYRNWYIRCVEPEKCILDITTKRIKIRFEIGPGYVYLRDREEPEFKHITDKKLTPGRLLKELYNCSVNLLPQVEDADQAHICRKSVETEDNAIYDVALAVRSFAIKAIKWSHQLPKEAILVSMRENVQYDETFAEVQKGLWKSVAFYQNFCGLLQCMQDDEQLNSKFVEGTDTHATLEYLFKKEGEEKIKFCQPREEIFSRFHDMEKMIFYDTIKQMLKLTKILTFSVGPR